MNKIIIHLDGATSIQLALSWASIAAPMYYEAHPELVGKCITVKFGVEGQMLFYHQGWRDCIVYQKEVRNVSPKVSFRFVERT